MSGVPLPHISGGGGGRIQKKRANFRGFQRKSDNFRVFQHKSAYFATLVGGSFQTSHYKWGGGERNFSTPYYPPTPDIKLHADRFSLIFWGKNRSGGLRAV